MQYAIAASRPCPVTRTRAVIWKSIYSGRHILESRCAERVQTTRFWLRSELPSRGVVFNSNMSRGKYLAREGAGSRLMHDLLWNLNYAVSQLHSRILLANILVAEMVVFFWSWQLSILSLSLSLSLSFSLSLSLSLCLSLSLRLSLCLSLFLSLSLSLSLSRSRSFSRTWRAQGEWPGSWLCHAANSNFGSSTWYIRIPN